MRIFISVFFFILCTSLSFAQGTPDQKVYTIDFSGIKNPDEKPELPKENTPLDPSPLSILPSQPRHLSKKSISGFNQNSVLDIENFGRLAPKQMQFGKPREAKKFITNQQPRFLQTEKGEGPVFQRDQDLGDLTTKSNSVQIKFRDYGNIDGDRIRLIVNDEVLIEDVSMVGSFTVYKLKLKEGFNRVDFLALNYGAFAPNTAQLKIVDDNFDVISNNKWSLSTGFKATIILIKE